MIFSHKFLISHIKEHHHSFRFFFVFVIATAIVMGLNYLVFVSVPDSLTKTAIAQSVPPLLNQSDLIYEGAFRVPFGFFGDSSFGYAHGNLTYNPINDSLFIVGHDHQQMTAEINTPTPVISSNLNDLPTATVLQPFVDAAEGLLSTIVPIPGHNPKMGGLLVQGNRLI